MYEEQLTGLRPDRDGRKSMSDYFLRSRLSMSRSLVSRFVLCFFLHRAFALVVALGFVALHRVSIRTLDELS